MNEQISLRISFLRFFLIIQVVIIHSYGFFLEPVKKDYTFWFQTYFSNVISRVAVPLFFIISSYLLFLKIKSISFQDYKSIISKKVLTLFIPHIIWNSFYLLFFYIIHQLLNYPYPFHFNSLIDALWGLSREPVAYQFWFIRDLFTLTLFFPLFFFSYNFLKIIPTLIMGVMWLFNIPLSIGYLWTEGIFFFMVGHVLAQNQNSLKYSSKYSIYIYLLLSVIDLVFQVLQYDYSMPIHRLTILFGIFAFWSLSDLLHPTLILKKDAVFKYAQLSFGIFALHQPILISFLKKISIYISTKISEIFLIPLYIIAIIITVFICIQLTSFIKRAFPKTSSILFGR
ncbi:acyltransferase family protein [Emticicia soli]|uniref:Acyltransferase family protein n=1 Tax=Emticicia soli TaxID=2027878 RepID=A0ABW5J598_9BACT